MTFDLQRVLLSVAIMAVVTYIIRVLPLAIFKKKIQNRFIRSFLAYVPYAVLAAMTFPAILFSTAEAVTVQSDGNDTKHHQCGRRVIGSPGAGIQRQGIAHGRRGSDGSGFPGGTDYKDFFGIKGKSGRCARLVHFSYGLIFNIQRFR